jgi:hypothetical protein
MTQYMPFFLTGFFPCFLVLVGMWMNNQRFNQINQRFDDMRDLWRAELRRVEEVLDARLKHLEEKTKD